MRPVLSEKSVYKYLMCNARLYDARDSFWKAKREDNPLTHLGGNMYVLFLMAFIIKNIFLHIQCNRCLLLYC